MQLTPITTEVPLALRTWWTSGELPYKGDTQSAWPRNVTDAAWCGRPVVSDGNCAPRPFTLGAPSARVRQLLETPAEPLLGLQTSMGHVPCGACAFVRFVTSGVGWFTG